MRPSPFAELDDLTGTCQKCGAKHVRETRALVGREYCIPCWWNVVDAVGLRAAAAERFEEYEPEGGER